MLSLCTAACAMPVNNTPAVRVQFKGGDSEFVPTKLMTRLTYTLDEARPVGGRGRMLPGTLSAKEAPSRSSAALPVPGLHQQPAPRTHCRPQARAPC